MKTCNLALSCCLAVLTITSQVTSQVLSGGHVRSGQPLMPVAPMVPMYNADMLDAHQDYMADLLQYRMQMDMLRGFTQNGYPASPPMINSPYYQPSNRPINNRPVNQGQAPQVTIVERPRQNTFRNQPVNTQRIRSSNAGTRKRSNQGNIVLLNRKKRFLPMPFGPAMPFAPVGGINPYMNPLVGGAIAAGQMVARRNRLGRFGRRSRTNTNRINSRAMTLDQSQPDQFQQVDSLNSLNNVNSLNNLNNVNSLNNWNNVNSLNNVNNANDFNNQNGLNTANDFNNQNGLNTANDFNNQNGLNTLNGINTLNNNVNGATALNTVNNPSSMANVNSLNGVNSVNNILGQDQIPPPY